MSLEHYLALSLTETLGPRRVGALLSSLGSVEAVFALSEQQWLSLGFKEGMSRRLLQPDDKKVQEAYKALRNSSILATKKGARINTPDKKGSSTKKTKINPPVQPTSNNKITFLTKKILAGITIVLITFLLTYTLLKTSTAPNPVYLDDNGITIKAKKWAKIGDQGIIDDVLYTILDKDSLLVMIEKGYFVNTVCTSLMTDMSRLFRYRRAFNQDISNWDVSNVNNMSSMFQDAESFNQPIGVWDVSNVTRMEYMFSGAYSFNQPIGTWDVSKVNSMKAMFSSGLKNYRNGSGKYENAELNFNQPIGGWDISNVKNMTLMFAGASSFNQDISSWNVSNVTKMRGMFYDASSFNQSLDSWGTSEKYTYYYDYPVKYEFSGNTPNWTLPKPMFKN